MAYRCRVVKSGEFCWECYRSLRRGAMHCDQARRFARERARKEFGVSKLCKPSDDGVNLAAPPVDGDGPVIAGFPTLYDYLTCVQYSGGEARVPSTMLFFCEDGMWKCCLNDRDNARSAWSAGRSVMECVKSLERALSDATVEWRRSAGVGKGRPRR